MDMMAANICRQNDQTRIDSTPEWRAREPTVFGLRSKSISGFIFFGGQNRFFGFQPLFETFERRSHGRAV
jgi:hypothetical protein